MRGLLSNGAKSEVELTRLSGHTILELVALGK